jgi:hypothetical protein
MSSSTTNERAMLIEMRDEIPHAHNLADRIATCKRLGEQHKQLERRGVHDMHLAARTAASCTNAQREMLTQHYADGGAVDMALSDDLKRRVEYLLNKGKNREETFRVVTGAVARIYYLIDDGSPLVQTSLFKQCIALTKKAIENLQTMTDLRDEEVSMMDNFKHAIKDKIEPFEHSMLEVTSQHDGDARA